MHDINSLTSKHIRTHAHAPLQFIAYMNGRLAHGKILHVSTLEKECGTVYLSCGEYNHKLAVPIVCDIVKQLQLLCAIRKNETCYKHFVK